MAARDEPGEARERDGIDDLYEGFASTLPEPLATAARGLAATLGLAPRPLPWSEVFAHEVTLAAPRLAAEAMPGLDPAAVRDATLAHLLAVVEAFGTDRIEDGQVLATADLLALLAHLRAARDAAISRVGGGSAYDAAEAETLAAIRVERALLGAGEPASFDRYLRVVHGKQRLGLPATLALARRAGWDTRRVQGLGALLDAISEGLQIHDDVVDWEDDLRRGGAWAVILSLAAGPPELASSMASPRARLNAAGVLPRMLLLAARRFRAARRRAEVLGLWRLAAWARERETAMETLARRETDAPGATARVRALSTWARIVLA